ncbi:hypothetical protein QW131_00020 [Roseibium salinum]|nr:hypothetical protein [Roseibium salinum]
MKIHLRPIAAFLSLIWLSACQYAGETTVSEPEDVGPPLNAEVIGGGETTLALVLPFAGSDALTAKHIRNGALLAREMLSDNKLALAVEKRCKPGLRSPEEPGPGRALRAGRETLRNAAAEVRDDHHR